MIPTVLIVVLIKTKILFYALQRAENYLFFSFRQVNPNAAWISTTRFNGSISV